MSGAPGRNSSINLSLQLICSHSAITLINTTFLAIPLRSLASDKTVNWAYSGKMFSFFAVISRHSSNLRNINCWIKYELLSYDQCLQWVTYLHLTGFGVGMRASKLEQWLLHPPRDSILDSDRFVEFECESVGLGMHLRDDVWHVVRGLSEFVQQFVIERQQVVRVHARIVPHVFRPRLKGPDDVIKSDSKARRS